jgi:mannose-6-phosphate isomerase-like protein (cupin superfamily)
MSLSRSELERFTAALVATPERWRALVRHSPARRVYAQIWDEQDLNAWLICWSRDHDTGFHDHERSAAVIAVIDGYVREERLRLRGEPRSQVLGREASVYVPPAAIHRVLHWGTAPAVTIHAYSPPLRTTGAYRLGPDGELERAWVPDGEELRPQLA